MIEQLNAAADATDAPSSMNAPNSSALGLIYQRHSTRSFKKDPLADSTVALLLDAAVHAPTAMHEEPWRFVVIQSRTVVERVSDVAKKLAMTDAAKHGRLLKPHGAAGDGIASSLANPEFNIFYDAGTVIAIGTDNPTEFTIADCWLAAENLMLAATALGLGSCCVGLSLGALNSEDVKTSLGIPTTGHVVAAIALGEANESELPGARKPPVVWNWIRR